MGEQIGFDKYTLPDCAQNLRVMLVDHDMTSLKKIKAKLEKFGYQVTGVNSASEALSMIQKDNTPCEFLLGDWTESNMDYRSFGRALGRIGIPFGWISDSYAGAKQALLDGAACFLVKQIRSNRLELLWQYRFRGRSNQKESHGIEIREAGGASSSAARLDLLDSQNKLVKNEQVTQRAKEEGLITTTNNQQEGSKHKRKINDQQGNMQGKGTKYNKSEFSSELQERNQNERGRRGDGKSSVWDQQRERKFQAAISELGQKATPTPILKKIGDPSLTRDQVASHLQKFRSSKPQKKEDSDATSSPFTDNSSNFLARHPGNQNLPTFPRANQNQYVNAITAASLSPIHQSQLSQGRVAATTELLGSAQARVTSGLTTNPDNFWSNFGDGIENQKPMVEQDLAAGSSNQNQPELHLPDVLLPDEKLDFDFVCVSDGICVEQTLAAGSSNQNQPQSDLAAVLISNENMHLDGMVE